MIESMENFSFKVHRNFFFLQGEEIPVGLTISSDLTITTEITAICNINYGYI